MSDEDPNDDRTSASEDAGEEEMDSDDFQSRASSAVPENLGQVNGGHSFPASEGEPKASGGGGGGGGFSRRQKVDAMDLQAFSKKLQEERKVHAFLKGKLERNYAGDHFFKGQWCLGYDSWKLASEPKSDFEFRHKAQDADETEMFPLSTKYEGWYKIKEHNSHKRHEDKELYLQFSTNSSGSYNVSGAGKNLYGNYTCTGLLTDIIGNTGTLEMFRVYDQAAPPPPPANEAATASTAAPAARRQSRPPVTQTDLSVSGSAAISPAHKKQGTGMGMGMMGAKLESKRKVGQGMMPKTSPVAKPKVGTGMGGGGMQPLPKVIPDKHVTRARQVVKQLREQVGTAAVSWFEKPVNEALAPGYSNIIAKPMDLGTVESKLKRKSYRTIYDFAADMRLIFRNALMFNLEGEACHGDALVCQKALEEVWKQACKELSLTYSADDPVSDGADARGVKKAKTSLGSNVGPRALSLTPAAAALSGSGEPPTDLMMESYREQVGELTKKMVKMEFDAMQTTAALELAYDRISALEKELSEYTGIPPQNTAELMRRRSSVSTAAAPARPMPSSQTVPRERAPPAKPAPTTSTPGHSAAEVSAMRQKVKDFVNMVAEGHFEDYTQSFVDTLTNLGIAVYEGNEITIDVDSYNADVIVTLYNFIIAIEESATQEEGQAEDESRMDESGAPDEAANGHEQAPPAAEDPPASNRVVKRPPSDSDDNDDAPLADEEATASKKPKPDAEPAADKTEAPAPAPEADGAKDAAMAVEEPKAEEEEEEEAAPAQEEEEEDREAARSRWAVDDEGKEGADGEEGADKVSPEDEELWRKAQEEKLEELRKAEERKRQAAAEEERVRRQKEETAARLVEEQTKLTQEAEEKAAEEQAKRRQALIDAREQERLKRQSAAQDG